MSSLRRPAHLALAGLAFVGALGCNTLVGIDMPTDRQTDAALQANPHTTTTGSFAVDAATDLRGFDDANVQSPTELDGAVGTGGSGGSSAQTPPPSNDAGVRTDAGLGACPSVMPAPQEPCRGIGLVCQYQDDPRGDACRDTATCSETGWLTTHRMCPPPPPAACPATRADARDKACSPILAWCTYDEGLSCQCTNCPPGYAFEDCGGPPIWHCQEPSSIPFCPAILPNAGTACDQKNLSCAYHCGAFGTRQCKDGIWVRGDGLKCPQIPPAD
jgi:hypothetical protein